MGAISILLASNTLWAGEPVATLLYANPRFSSLKGSVVT